MEYTQAKELYETYLNGNISDYKKSLNKLSKKDLMNFAFYVTSEFGGDGFYCTKKYLEDWFQT